MEQLEIMIITGVYSKGEKIPSVRELAILTQINPNTVQRALMEIENKGLIFTKRNSGKFVTENSKLLMKLQEKIKDKYIENYFLEMEQIGFSKEQAILEITKQKERENESN